MREELERQNAVNEARAALWGVICLLAEARAKAEVPVDGIHALLNCVLSKLERAAQ